MVKIQPFQPIARYLSLHPLEKIWQNGGGRSAQRPKRPARAGCCPWDRGATILLTSAPFRRAQRPDGCADPTVSGFWGWGGTRPCRTERTGRRWRLGASQSAFAQHAQCSVRQITTMLRPTKPQHSRARWRRTPPELHGDGGAKSERLACAGARLPRRLPTAWWVDVWLAAPCATAAPTRSGTTASVRSSRRAPRRPARGPWRPPERGGRAR